MEVGRYDQSRRQRALMEMMKGDPGKGRFYGVIDGNGMTEQMISLALG